MRRFEEPLGELVVFFDNQECFVRRQDAEAIIRNRSVGKWRDYRLGARASRIRRRYERCQIGFVFFKRGMHVRQKQRECASLTFRAFESYFSAEKPRKFTADR